MAMAKKQGLVPSPAGASSEWPDKAVAALLKSYAQRFSVDRGYLRTSDWEEVAHCVNTSCDGLRALKTLKQCRDKVDSLKRRYKMEKRKAVNGFEVSWPFFQRLDEIMNSVTKQGKSHSQGVHNHGHSPNNQIQVYGQDQGQGQGQDFINRHVHHHHQQQQQQQHHNHHPQQPQYIQYYHHHQQQQNHQQQLQQHHYHGDQFMEEDTNAEYSNSHEDLAASTGSPYYMDSHKGAAGIANHDTSDDELNPPHPYPYPLRYRQDLHPGRENQRQFRYPRRYIQHEQVQCTPYGNNHNHLLLASRAYTSSGGTQESTENSSQGLKPHNAKRKQMDCNNGIDALADVVTDLSKPGSAVSFSDVFSRIELVKMEIFSKMSTELAKLERKRHKKSSNKGKLQRTVSTAGS